MSLQQMSKQHLALLHTACHRACPHWASGRGSPKGPHTQETGHPGVGGISRVQVDLVGVEPCRCDGQVAAQPVDVLHKGHVHLQGPLPGGLLRMSDINAGTPGAGEGEGPGGVLSSRVRGGSSCRATPPWSGPGVGPASRGFLGAQTALHGESALQTGLWSIPGGVCTEQPPVDMHVSIFVS